MHETEGELLARIDATRARMGETIEQIGDRVNPDRVQAELKARAREQVREVKANVKHKARNAMRDMEHEMSDAGRTVWDTIRENPIPAGMVGLGLAWLVANGATRDDRALPYRGYAGAGLAGNEGYLRYPAAAAGSYDDVDYGYDVRPGTDGASEERGMADEARDRMRHAAESARDHAGEAADSVREHVGDAADSVREHAGELAHQVRDRASHMAHRASEEIDDMQHWAADTARRAGHGARRAERRVEHAVQENPLAAGAIAAALGFAAGLMIPESRREHEMLGPTRDRLVHSAERTVRRAGEKARDAAKDAASEGARRVVDEMTGGGGKNRERASVSEPGR